MNTVELILVILLSVGFLVLLILSIILVSIMLGIMRNVKRISEHAEEATAGLSNIVSTVGRRVAPVAVSGVVAAAMRWFKKRKEEGR